MKKIILLFIILLCSIKLYCQPDWNVHLDKNLTWINLLQKYIGKDNTYLGTRLIDDQNHVLLLRNNSIIGKLNYIEAIVDQANITEIAKGKSSIAALTVFCDCQNLRVKIAYIYDLETDFGGPTGNNWLDGIGDSMGSRILESVCKFSEYKEFVDLISENGVFKVPVILNNSVFSYFIFDTGASDLFISPKIKAKLISNNSLSEQRDFIGKTSYVDANGTVEVCDVYHLKSVKVGNREIENVTCAVANNDIDDMLLGQSFMEKLGTFEINFSTNRLIFK